MSLIDTIMFRYKPFKNQNYLELLPKCSFFNSHRAVYPPPATSIDMFHNEVLFYTKVLPLLRRCDTCDVLSTSFPELVYGKAVGKPEEDIVVLKDLRQKGFQPCVDPERLDERHIELVLDRLGKFHALSFVCKQEDPMGFERVTSQMRELVYAEAVSAFGGFLTKEVRFFINTASPVFMWKTSDPLR